VPKREHSSYLFIPLHASSYLFIPLHTSSCLFIPLHTSSYLFIPPGSFAFYPDAVKNPPAQLWTTIHSPAGRSDTKKFPAGNCAGLLLIYKVYTGRHAE